MSEPLYHSYAAQLRRRFPFPVRKVSLDAGFGCPHRTGPEGAGGCAFCVPASFSPALRRPAANLAEQFAAGAAVLRRRWPQARFLAYLQPFSNTYAPLERLRAVYREALALPDVVGLSLGTRPDCLPAETVELLAELAQTTYVHLELGLQSCHDRTLARIGRGHTAADFAAAAERCRGWGFELCGHLIVGLPGESGADAVATARFLAACGVTGIKLHNLYLPRGSRLAEEYEREPFPLLTEEAYCAIAADILEALPPSIAIERLWATARPEEILGPAWCATGASLQPRIEAELRRRGTRQGSRAD